VIGLRADPPDPFKPHDLRKGQIERLTDCSKSSECRPSATSKEIAQRPFIDATAAYQLVPEIRI